jgi:hypothetical protein
MLTNNFSVISPAFESNFAAVLPVVGSVFSVFFLASGVSHLIW